MHTARAFVMSTSSVIANRLAAGQELSEKHKSAACPLVLSVSPSICTWPWMRARSNFQAVTMHVRPSNKLRTEVSVITPGYVV